MVLAPIFARMQSGAAGVAGHSPVDTRIYESETLCGLGF